MATQLPPPPLPPQQPQQQHHQLWADKYRPRLVSEMCYPAMANRLKAWLEAFPREIHTNPKANRAALLSGPPGVGKTTTAHLVARELGFRVVEFNASDHRSAKSLNQSVADLVDNRVMDHSTGFASGTNPFKRPSPAGDAAANGNGERASIGLEKFVLLMDEVDGCDRGGVGEIIAMIKRTKVPIICTCNDRYHQKLKSLANHVEDLKFSRPPFNVVAAYLRDRVLAREGVTVPHQLLQDVIKLEGNDIRSVLNNLQLWSRSNRNMSERQLVHAAKSAYKNEDVGLFAAAESILLQGSSANQGQPRKTMAELQSLYYSADLVDLFVQENYLHFKPDHGDWLAATAKSAASISRADVVRRMAFVDQNWSVSNYHVLASAIAPCAYNRGHYQSFLSGPAAGFDRSRPVKFPMWLGSNSTAGKNQRLMACLAKQGQHPTAGFSGNADDVALDYAWVMGSAVTQPLAAHGKEGIPAVMATVDAYKMEREDVDFVQDVTRFKKMVTPSVANRLFGTVPTPIKTAFTKAFNAGHKTARVPLRGKIGYVPETQVVEDEDGGEDQADGDGSSGDEGTVSGKRHRAEAATAAKPKPKAKAATTAKPRAKAAAKPRGKKAGA